jgi:hypothetical protein
MQVRVPTLGALMEDVDNSAHQFSVRDQSMQADSEERIGGNEDNISARSCVSPPRVRSVQRLEIGTK